MTLRSLFARAFRHGAAWADGFEVSTAAQRTLMAEAATKYRDLAQRLDPYVTRCAVCEMPLTAGEATDGQRRSHACTAAAMRAFEQRAREAGYDA